MLLYRLRWFHAPAAVLMMLLQRTPVLRLVTGGTVNNVGLQSADVLKSVFALAALGAYNSVAGATTFNATVVSPTTVTPASGPANSTFTASGAASAAFSLSFNASGAPGATRAWKVLGTLPAGLSVTGGTAITGGYLFNGLTKVTLAGTPTTAGSQTLTFTAYDTTGGTGNNARVTCIVTITGGVSAAPAFTTQPSSQTVSAGANVTFTAVATGTPTPTFQWYKDSVALSGKTSATLSLTNVQTGDAGSYTVTATNSEAPSGVTSSAATLTVNPVPSVPKIIVQPVAATTAMIGDTVTLSVQATGFPSPSYQWRKKKVILPGQTGPTLTLGNVQIANAGTYNVLVTNSGLPKGVTSQSSVLTVRVPPPAILTSGVLHVGDPVAWDLKGGAPYPAGVTFFAAKFPRGLTLNATTGQISGTVATKPATYKMTYWTQSGKTRSTVFKLNVVVVAAALKTARTVNAAASATAAPVVTAAKFAALLDATSASAPLPVGKVEINVSSGGAFTGRLITGDPTAYAVRGRLQRGGALDLAGATITVARARSLNAPDYRLTLSVSDAGTLFVSLDTSDGAVGEGEGVQLADIASADVYTMVMRHPVNLGDLADYPSGDGTFDATITPGGLLKITGKTPDGASLTTTAALGVDNVFRLYAKPYGTSSGYLAGSLLLTARADNPSLHHITAANGSDLYLSKPAMPGDASYANGFGPIGLEATMEPLNAPSPSAP
ncbi:MAG: immunoglobulin domain-containing protein [Opitutaceae bacterium]|jgi:hypothetical protein